VRFESFGLEEAAGGVVRQVVRSQGVLETAVDRLCGFVAGAGAVEAHEDSRAICLRVRSRRHGSTSMVGTPLARESITDCLTNLPGFGSGSRLAMTMHWQMTKVASILACCLIAEQILQACLLAFGEQPGAGVEGTASSCRTGRHLRPRRPERVAPNTPAILVEGTAGRSHDVEGTITVTASGSSTLAAVLKLVNPSHRDDLDPVP
jgi:hypothetical protein